MLAALPVGAAAAAGLAALAIICLIFAVMIYLRETKAQHRRRMDSPAPPSSPAVANVPAVHVPKPAPPPPVMVPEGEDETLPVHRAEKEMAAIAAAAKKAAPMPTADEAKEMEDIREYLKAAELYHLRSDFVAERRVLMHTEEYERLAALDLALGDTQHAVESLRKVLQQKPTDEAARMALVQALLDEGHIPEARALIDALRPDPDSRTIRASARFVDSAAKSFQAVGEFRSALRLCKTAMALNSSIGDTAVRTVYLTKIAAVARTRPPSAMGGDGRSKDVVAAALGDDDTQGLVRAMLPAPTKTAEPPSEAGEDLDALLKPHEVVVGHLALGGLHRESPVSVRSYASMSSRLELVRVVGERTSSVVFEGVDRLLDCPVAIRLSRISTDGEDYELIRDRIRAIATLNHPNLSKITFADRFGPVMRIVTEYHSGGNLVSLLARLDQLGLPLALRLLLQICSGLEAAHRQGILHGDLRPENILIGHDNLTKLVDFALRPWPVHRMRAGDDPNQTAGASRGIPASEAQSDIMQFADIMETVLKRVTLAKASVGSSSADPTDELNEVVQRARNGSFSTLAPLHRILLEILDRTMPAARQ